MDRICDRTRKQNEKAFECRKDLLDAVVASQVTEGPTSSPGVSTRSPISAKAWRRRRSRNAAEARTEAAVPLRRRPRGRLFIAVLGALMLGLVGTSPAPAAVPKAWTGTVTLENHVELEYYTPNGIVDAYTERMVAKATIRGTNVPGGADQHSWTAVGDVSASITGESHYFQSADLIPAGSCLFSAKSRPKLIGSSFDDIWRNQNFEILRIIPDNSLKEDWRDEFRLFQFHLNFSGTQTGKGVTCDPKYETTEGYTKPFPERVDLSGSMNRPDLPGLHPVLSASGVNGPELHKDGSKRWRGTQTLSNTRQREESQISPGYKEVTTSIWTYDLTYHPTSDCQLKANGQQKVGNALAARITGGKTGCKAKIKSVKFKVGNKIYSNVKKLSSKQLKAGKTWKFDFPINGNFLKTVKNALKKGKKVQGKITAALDGEESSVTVTVK